MAMAQKLFTLETSNVSCHKAIVVIYWRAYFFHDYIYLIYI